MKRRKVTEAWASTRSDMVAVPVFGGAASGEAWQALDGGMGGALARIAREEAFSGQRGKTLLVHTHGALGAARVLLVGLGKASALDVPAARLFAHTIAKQAATRRTGRVALAWTFGERAGWDGELEELALGLALGAYRFDRHREPDEEGPFELAELVVHVPAAARRTLTSAKIEEAWARGEGRAAGVTLARDLVNEPANEVQPEALVACARELAERHDGLTLEVLDRAAMEERGMGLLLGVAAGAESEPALIHLRWEPAEPNGKTVALVGKGITFDAGGLDIKTRGNMLDMKCDMAGGAAVLGAMAAVPVVAPRCIVHALVPAAENLLGAGAYRPGDVVRGMGGKTVEVMNTDAEGRLVMADAISYAIELGADEIVDMATLTGACAVALGEYTAGLFANRRALADRLLKAARVAGESLWQLPIDRRLDRELKSRIADMKNIGGRYGGAIHGALFLQRFVEKKAWAHIDIAGPAYLSRAEGVAPQGGTGFGVLTLLEYLVAS